MTFAQISKFFPLVVTSQVSFSLALSPLKADVVFYCKLQRALHKVNLFRVYGIEKGAEEFLFSKLVLVFTDYHWLDLCLENQELQSLYYQHMYIEFVANQRLVSKPWIVIICYR